jgi:hypothetical protein
MSDDEQPQFSDLEDSDIDNIKDNDNGNSRLHDPTGQYANGKLTDHYTESSYY